HERFCFDGRSRLFPRSAELFGYVDRQHCLNLPDLVVASKAVLSLAFLISSSTFSRVIFLLNSAGVVSRIAPNSYSAVLAGLSLYSPLIQPASTVMASIWVCHCTRS